MLGQDLTFEVELGMEKEIDEYIGGFPRDIQKGLNELRAAIRKAAPDATEKMSYGMPTFYLHRNLVHFAAATKHFGFYPAPSAITAFAKELSSYETSKGAVKFPFGKRLPLALIQKIVKFRVKENEAAFQKRKSAARRAL